MARKILGTRAVREALRARRDISAMYIEHKRDVGDLVHQARGKGLTVDFRTKPEMDSLAEGGRHQGVIAIAGEYDYAELDQLCNGDARALLLGLDSIQDPHNLGALVRSACVFGATGVVIPRNRAAKITPAVVRASAGATEHVRIALVTNMARSIEDLQRQGIGCVAAVSEGGVAPRELDLTGPTMLVVGAEDKGVRRLVAERCERNVTIPTPGPVESLNASVAGGVLLYEASRQRGNG